MNAHRNRSKEPTKKEIPSHIAYAPNEVWTWDITWLKAGVKGFYYKLYLILDMYSRYIVGYEVWETEKTSYAEQLIRKATLSQGINGRPLVLHSDNGSPMKAASFLATLEKLGVQSSFSRPRVSNDNPYSESLFRTMKYRNNYPYKGFKSLEEAREWAKCFVQWYNHEHYHSAIKFISPYQRHYRLDEAIMGNRKKVYEQAKQRHPERFGPKAQEIGHCLNM
jgi:transposase InsO family protein